MVQCGGFLSRPRKPQAMPLGVRPKVDFAFKKIVGSPQNSLALIGLLNAILDLRRPIEAVEIS